MINAEGKRFVDEGQDFYNYTYAKYGAVILSQPQQFAWQIFDSKVLDKLRDEYRIKQVTKATSTPVRTCQRTTCQAETEGSRCRSACATV